MSNRSLGKLVGVSHVTVGVVRAELVESGKLPVKINHVEEMEMEWWKHPYLIKNPHILENTKDREYRAFRTQGVVDKMAEIGCSSAVYAQSILRRETEAARKNTSVELGEDACHLYVADIKDGLPMIADGSVDLILTDIDYRNCVTLSEHLGAVAVRVLCENGVLLCMTWQSYLPE